MAIKQRMEPTSAQATAMLEHCQMARFVWNIALEQRSMWTKDRRHFAEKITATTQARQLAELRAAIDWVRAGSSVVQQAALRDLDRAFSAFFDKRASYPKFKRRNDAEGSFAVRDVSVRRLNRRWATILVPKVGWVRFRLTRPWKDVAKATSARVSLKAGRWHVALTTTPPPRIIAGTGLVAGIDRGVTNALATSDGALVSMPKPSSGELDRMLELQRRLARQRRGSNRRARTKSALARMHARVSDRRTDWIEQTSTAIAQTYDVAVLERLNTAGMTRRPKPKPDPERAGAFLANGARSKAGLNRSILASRWGEFERRLSAKMADGAVIFVDPRFTSQTCPRCGLVDARSRESQAAFACIGCGYEAHADTNAAVNILARADLAQPEGIGGSDASARREPAASTTRDSVRGRKNPRP